MRFMRTIRAFGCLPGLAGLSLAADAAVAQIIRTRIAMLVYDIHSAEIAADIGGFCRRIQVMIHLDRAGKAGQLFATVIAQ